MFGFVKCLVVLGVVATASGFNLALEDVVFHLFSRTNPQLSEPLLANVNSIMTSSFSLQRSTVITIHSNGENVGGNFNAFVIPATLSAVDVNLIAVDWSAGSSMYTEGLSNAPQAGRIIASFINILTQSFGYNPDLIRIVGVGLGGHLAGITARNAAANLPHIIAIDPSFHGWTHNPEILSADDARVVEVLYATAGSTGYDYPIGSLNFYANGGSNQNGCGNDISCSHIYAYAFYAESLTAEVNGGNKFVGTACESYENAITLSCDGATDAVFGGTDVKSSESGIYIFVTNFAPPFARG